MWSAEVHLSLPLQNPATEKEIPSLHLHFLPLVLVSLSPHWKKEGEMKRVIDRKRRIQCRALGEGGGGDDRMEKLTEGDGGS